MNVIYFVVCALILAIATYTDLRNGKIPNQLFYPVLGLSVTVPFTVNFWDFLFRLGLVVFIFFAYEGVFGGGDAKLIMMLVILAGPVKTMIAVAAGIVGAIVYSYINNPSATKASLMNGLVAIQTFKPSMVKGKGLQVVFAPFLATGFLLATLICGV